MKNIAFKNKKALVRVDFNVPLTKTYEITDDTRIRAAVPTLKFILDQGGKAILMSHLGRPQKDLDEQGKIKRHKYSLVHTVDRLAELLGRKVFFIDETIGDSVNEAVKALKESEVLIIENTRFYPEEKNGDIAFAKQLSELGDVYINDAFGTAHRAHASTATVASFFKKEDKAFGFLIQRELEAAKRLTEDPESPVVAILGGAKVSDKIQLVKKLLPKIDHLIIGGGMAYTFVKALGGKIGNSLVENDKMDLALEILQEAKELKTTVHLPIDNLCAMEFSPTASAKVYPTDAIEDGWQGLDIGPETIKTYINVLKSAKTVFWNGPMGVFEFDNFAKGTNAIAKAVAEVTKEGAYSLIGGGDSVAAINKAGLENEVSFISTGGGAMLTLLEGNDLPGIEAILS